MQLTPRYIFDMETAQAKYLDDLRTLGQEKCTAKWANASTNLVHGAVARYQTVVLAHSYIHSQAGVLRELYRAPLAPMAKYAHGDSALLPQPSDVIIPVADVVQAIGQSIVEAYPDALHGEFAGRTLSVGFDTRSYSMYFDIRGIKNGGEPFGDGTYTWSIDERSITFTVKDPCNARENGRCYADMPVEAKFPD